MKRRPWFGPTFATSLWPMFSSLEEAPRRPCCINRGTDDRMGLRGDFDSIYNFFWTFTNFSFQWLHSLATMPWCWPRQKRMLLIVGCTRVVFLMVEYCGTFMKGSWDVKLPTAWTAGNHHQSDARDVCPWKMESACNGVFLHPDHPKGRLAKAARVELSGGTVATIWRAAVVCSALDR